LIDRGDSIGDTLFDGVSSLEWLRMTGTNALTLGSSAAAAGLVSIAGGFGEDTVTIVASDTLGHWIYERTSLNFRLNVPDPSRLGLDTVMGNGFAGTLSIGTSGSAVSLGDSAFAHLTGLTDLELSGSANLTLGAAAGSSGIRSVSMGGGAVSLTQAAGNTQRYRIDGSSADHLSVSVATASQLRSDYLIGSTGDADTLAVGSGPIADSYFTTVSDFENLVLSGSMAVTLGYQAFGSGIGTVYGGSGSSTIAQTSDDYNAMLLDCSAGSNNLFRLVDPGLVSNDTLIGGGGINTLSLGSAGSLDDDAFAFLSRIQLVKLANGSNTLEAGANALASGLRKVTGGTGSDLIDASGLPVSNNASGMTLDGGGSASFADTLTGSPGSDLFVLGGTAGTSYATTAVGTANFAFVTNLSSDSLIGGAVAGDRLQLCQADAAKYTLGAPANNGLRTASHFGLYDNGKFVADITTSGFDVATDGSRNAAFLDPSNNHVVYV
jgi:X-X-X-Leu-X-X-Gly heptad repeat protein